DCDRGKEEDHEQEEGRLQEHAQNHEEGRAQDEQQESRAEEAVDGRAAAVSALWQAEQAYRASLASTLWVSASQSLPAKGKAPRKASCRLGARATCSRRRARNRRVLTVCEGSTSAVSSTLSPSTARNMKTIRNGSGKSAMACSRSLATWPRAASTSGVE